MKRLKNISVLILLIAAITVKAQVATPPSEGDGTIDNPYQIATLDNLYWISQNNSTWDKSFIQIADIDANTTSGWNNGAGLSPIGNYDTKFTGIYNGSGYEIDLIFINRPLDVCIALFGFTDGAKIDSLGVTNVNITGGESNIGGLIGWNNDSEISNSYCTGSVSGGMRVACLVGYNTSSKLMDNCYSAGTVSGDYNVGGIAGYNTTPINNCYNTANVSGNHSAGGIVGYNMSAEISNSYNNGDIVSTGGSIGGIAGITNRSNNESDSSKITNCYNTGNIVGTEYIGGIVGYHYNKSTINNSYNIGNINGDIYLGGIVGGNLASSNINNCYSQGDVTASGNETYSYTGGFVGTNDVSAINKCYSTGFVSGANNFIGGFSGINLGTENNNFWDIQTSGQSTSDAGTGLVTSEMHNLSTYTNSGWDFIDETTNGTNDYWGINANENNGYPFLEWQGYPHVTGINDIEIESVIKLFPNPTNNFLQVESGEYQIEIVRIFDITGYIATQISL